MVSFKIIQGMGSIPRRYPGMQFQVPIANGTVSRGGGPRDTAPTVPGGEVGLALLAEGPEAGRGPRTPHRRREPVLARRGLQSEPPAGEVSAALTVYSVALLRSLFPVSRRSLRSLLETGNFTKCSTPATASGRFSRLDGLHSEPPPGEVSAARRTEVRSKRQPWRETISDSVQSV